MGFRSSSFTTQTSLFLLALVALQLAVDGKSEYACRSLFFPFCDTTKTVVERVDDLVSRLDLQERIQQLSNTAASIPRLGIPSYQWWQEALHGVAQSPGVTFNGSIKSATSFPQTIVTAASFNDTLIHLIAQVIKQDMEDTFNLPFQSCIQEGRGSCLMCSYNRVNGIPMSGSHSFLTETAWANWGLEGYIVSDCDAVYDMTNDPAYSQTLEDAVADSLLAGLDLDCGITYRDHAELAMSQGKLEESHLNAALHNMFVVQMRLGLFDGDLRSQRYGDLGVKMSVLKHIKPLH